MTRTDDTQRGPGAKRGGESGESGNAGCDRPESQQRRGVAAAGPARVGRGKNGERLGIHSLTLSASSPSRPPSAPALARVQTPAKPREESPASAPHYGTWTAEDWRQAVRAGLKGLSGFLQAHACTGEHPSGYHLDAVSVRAFEGLVARLDLVVRNAGIVKSLQDADAAVTAPAASARPAARLRLVHSRPTA